MAELHRAGHKRRLLTAQGLWVGLCCLLMATCAWAQLPVVDADDVLEQSRRELEAIREALTTAEDDAVLAELRAAATEVQARLQEVRDRIEPERAAVEARIAQLGPVPEGEDESPTVAEQRAQVESERTALNDRARLAAVLSLEAQQATAQITARRRTLFQARLGERAQSPLAPTFWSALDAEGQVEVPRLRAFLTDVRAALLSATLVAWLGMLLATVVIIASRVRAERWLLERIPSIASGRLRRSIVALGTIVVRVAAAVLVAYVLRLALGTADVMAPRVATFVTDALATGVFGVYVFALGSVLLSPADPQGRLIAMPDYLARALRGYPALLAVVVVLSTLVEQGAAAVNVTFAATVAVTSVIAFALWLTLAYGLRRVTRARSKVSKQGAGAVSMAASSLPSWLSMATGIAWILLITSALAMLTGYVALGSFIVKQLVWAIVLAGTAYLLSVTADDLLTSYFANPRTSPAQDAGDVTPSGRARIGVLLSALVRVIVTLVALLLFLAPYGAGPIEFLGRVDQAFEGVAVGEVQLSPYTIGRAILVLFLGIAAVRIVREWLRRRYLPTTSLNAAMRDYITSLLSFIGYVLVVMLALSGVGIALNQLGWIVSGLAVGIGFGLQAIVQNFIAGVILLTEGKIRVGDWVALGDVEGDVRRIDIRATEVQRGDRSTVIVPNSEFITKTVRNVTYASSLGVVQIKLPVPRSADVTKIRDLIVQAFNANEAILQSPAPSVLLENVDAANVIFNAVGYTRSPRIAYATRSAILFELLEAMNDS